MRTLKAIVVEDERLPRLSLLQKLEEFRHEVEVIGSCDNYDSALQSILRLQPDLLFLDIQLQGRDAIQLLNEVRHTISLPHVIFTTAYDDRKYLMEAIKMDAVDYLLKPVGKNELAVAITKACQQCQEKLLERSPEKRLSLRTTNGKLYVDADNIAFVTADGNYSHLHTFSDMENVLESLAAIERMLDPSVFLRVDRGTIVNTHRIYKVNAKRQQCTLLSPEGTAINMKLSKAGIERLMRLL
ncbi:MAG: response regulator transcription factor [Prevotella sp.]|nr:response regulator transcription factor [Prevotella sp.]